MRDGRTITSVLGGILICSTLSVSSVFAEQPGHRVTVALIDKPWAVSLDLSGYTIHIDGVTPDGRRYLFATHTAASITVSVMLERVKGEATAQGCLAHLRQAAEASTAGRYRDLKEYEVRRMTAVEYVRPGADGSSPDQFHLLTCSGEENVYTDLHLSKNGFKAGDESLVRDILSTLAVVPAPAARSLDYFRAGSAPFLQAQYAQAVPHYEQALALEQSHPTLDKPLWRLLVHNLGTAYRLTGNLPRALRILEYGLSKDPANPLFHYNLARLHAGMNDRAHAMQSLHAAFEHRRTNGNESLPDPRQDDCFRRVMLDPSFRALVDRLMQPAI